MTESASARKAGVLSTLFRDYDGPAFAIRLWDGWRWTSSAVLKPVCTLVLQQPKALATLISKPNEVTLGEAFIRGYLDVEGDIFAAFPIAQHLISRPRNLRQQLSEKLACTIFGLGQWFCHGACHSPRRDRASIAYHYDQPVDFYQPWLGRSLVYSCAYFHSPQDSLDTAQEQKLEHICRKLRLRPSERFLDIGCGWGSLVLHAASRHQVQAHGITLSHEQASTARRRIEQAGLRDSCSAELRDYRQMEEARGSFDKIASVGMFEHVGLRNLPRYFKAAYRLLKPGGLFLNHGIARSPLAPTPQSSFIDRFVFPDGRLVTLSEAVTAAEAQGLEVRDVENLREHYELTLRRWVDGLRQNKARLLDQVPLVTYRIWLLYMAGSAAAFHRGDIAIYQVLFSRPDQGSAHLPLTRNDWYTQTETLHKVHA